ncbi:MAG: dTDP-4-amino-4,6-dideoxygalactose transaminase [Helicobacteraceae bacterium 4484_230]|nr:MAG: dTDP-4-amino-4,6-dideoxygalactose transaminase [Helicobacteraceae bacterium 4484_230]
MIPFNKPPYTGNEEKYVLEAMRSSHIAGDGMFALKCQEWFEKRLMCHNALFITSCTHALEMAAMLIDIGPGDEVIMPSFTFVSTANAFVVRGARIVFVDIHPDTMNIDETLIEAAITERTKAIVPVHYAGVGCEMDAITEIAERYGLFVIEDAAQGMTSTYKGKILGTIGHMGTYSFHETKNYTSGGEGGLLIINDERFAERADIIREKGTNRMQFFRGQVDKYSWVDLGSSYLPSELQAAYLWGQLENVDKIRQARLKNWHYYYEMLADLESKGFLERPQLRDDAEHNAHMFYIKIKDLKERTALLSFLKENGVLAVFHYVPLHDSPAGKKFSYFHGKDNFTSSQSDRLIRLPMYYGLTQNEQGKVVEAISRYFMQ